MIIRFTWHTLDPAQQVESWQADHIQNTDNLYEIFNLYPISCKYRNLFSMQLLEIPPTLLEVKKKAPRVPVGYPSWLLESLCCESNQHNALQPKEYFHLGVEQQSKNHRNYNKDGIPETNKLTI